MTVRKAGAASTDKADKLLIDKLATSGLNADDAKCLHINITKSGALKDIGLPEKLSFEIPYFKANGQLSGFKRWRYLEETRTGFELHTSKKSMRYVQAPGTNSEIYMPPFDTDWKAIQKDASIPFVITEGELKAACCTKYTEYPCIGLGGVSSFKSAKRGCLLLPAFKEFNWQDRQVIIAFDSDAATNSQVSTARSILCAELTALGAVLYIALTTPDEFGKKRGLDDIVMQEGAQALQDLLTESEEFSQSKELHKLNDEVAYVINPGIVIVLETGQQLRPYDFTNHAYSDRCYTVQVPTGKKDNAGNDIMKPVEKPAAPKWLAWPYRAVLNKITYSPGAERITEAKEYNTWPGWHCEPKRGTVKPWTDLLNHLFQDFPAERSWFERWCAFPIQHPGAKMYSATVLWGHNTGTGKSLIGYSLKNIYGKNFTEIGDTELGDVRKEWARDKQFVMGDDVTGKDHRFFADRLKKMITQQEIRIDPKYIPSYILPDCINYYFTANHSDAFYVEDQDRRYFIHGISVDRLSDTFYKAYMDWLNGDGAGFLFHHLLTLDLKGMKAEDRAMETLSKQIMTDDSASDLGLWARTLRDDTNAILCIGSKALPGDLWSAAELLKLYDHDGSKRVTVNGLSRELKRAGFKQACRGMPVRLKLGQARLFAIRDPAKWYKATQKAAAEHHAASRGLHLVQAAKF